MIKIAGSYELEASVEKVWPHIFDPQSLMNLIPGCQQLEQVGPDEYRGQIQVAIAAVSGIYQTYVRVVERDPPHRCCFEGEVNGATGIIKGEASFTLKEVEEKNKTSLEYEAKGMITGAMARLNPRYAEGVARTLIKQGLANLNKQLQSQAVPNPPDQVEV